MTKDGVRLYIEKCGMPTLEEKRRQELYIAKKLLAILDTDPVVHTVLGYRALDNEVDIDAVLLSCLEKNDIKLLLPKVGEKNVIELFEVTSLDDCIVGIHGIFEPDPTKAERYNGGLISHAFVPGRAFTKKDLARLGRGGGYYDTLFTKHIETKKIGICFAEQIVIDLPMEDHDVPMDIVISGEE